jgi:hypothetical protein
VNATRETDVAENSFTQRRQRRWGHVFGRRHVKSRRDLVRAELAASRELLRQAAMHAAGGLGAGFGPSIGTARSTDWGSTWGSARDQARVRAMSAREQARNRAMSARGMMRPDTDRMSGALSEAATRRWDATIASFAPLAEAARAGSEKAARLEAKRNKRNKRNGVKKRFMVTAQAEEHDNNHTALYALLATGAAIGAAGALVARRRTRAKWAEYEPSSLSEDASSFLGAGATSKYPMAGGVNRAKDKARSAVDSMRHRHDTGAEAGQMGAGRNGRFGDTPDARMNVRAEGTGRPTDRIDDEVDSLLRSAENGRM